MKAWRSSRVRPKAFRTSPVTRASSHCVPPIGWSSLGICCVNRVMSLCPPRPPLERPHVVEELVIEMEVGKLRVWQRNGWALDHDRANLGRSRIVSPLSSQGVLDLLRNPLRLLGRRGPEQHENIALVNVLVELALPALAGFQVQKVLKETHVQTLEHLNSLHHLVQVFHGIGDECLLVTACLVTQRLRLGLLTSASDERLRPRGGLPRGRRKGRHA